MYKLNMFITAVCVLFLIKLRWPKNKTNGTWIELLESALEALSNFTFLPIRTPYLGLVISCGGGQSHIRDSFQNFRRDSPSFFCGNPPWVAVSTAIFITMNDRSILTQKLNNNMILCNIKKYVDSEKNPSPRWDLNLRPSVI